MEVLPQIAPPPGRKKEPKPAHDPFEHRHYAAFHPTCNKLLSKRWEDHSRELHYKRLRQAKSTIDNSQPRVYPHLEMRLKRLQIEEERLHEIDRKNSILLDRITFQKTNPSGVSNLQQTDWPEMRALTNAVRDHRKRRMERIQKENLVILQRIEEKAPYYNRLEWMADRNRNVGYLCNISTYPYQYLDLAKNGASKKKLPSPLAPIKTTTTTTTAKNAPATTTTPKSDPASAKPMERPQSRGSPVIAPLSESDANEEEDARSSAAATTQADDEQQGSRGGGGKHGRSSVPAPAPAAAADNRAVHVREDEESAKAAIDMSADLKDLGILDDDDQDDAGRDKAGGSGGRDGNSDARREGAGAAAAGAAGNGDVTAASGGAEEEGSASRPSSGWSGFAEAASEDSAFTAGVGGLDAIAAAAAAADAPPETVRDGEVEPPQALKGDDESFALNGGELDDGPSSTRSEGPTHPAELVMDEDPTLEAAKWLEDEKPEEADKAALIQPDAAEEMKDYDVILNNFEGDAPAEPSHLDTPPEAISSPVADEDTSNGPSGLPDANMEEQISLPVESDEISDEAHKPTVEISRSNSPLSVTQSPHPTARNEENVSEGKRGGISQENDAQDDFHQKVSTSGDKEEDYKTEGETPSEVDGAISRPAPLPPIEKQSTSQTMLKSGSRASLPRSSHASSRPLTASLYQRPLSRPMSERLSVAEILGHAQEAAAAPESPRGSLPALVKTSSAPSSRPISAKLPPLSRPVSAKAADGELSVLNKDDGRSSASRAEAVTPGRVSRSSSARVQKPTPPTSSRPQSRISGSMARGLDKKLSELAQESQEAPKENQVDGDAADGEVESRNVSRRSSASLRADPARLSATGGEKDSEEAQATSVNDEPLEELAISHESLVGGTPEEEQATEETPKDNASNSEDVPPESAPAGKSRPHSVISAEHIADVVTENPDAEEGTTSRHLTPVRSEDESKDGQEAPQAESSARNSPKESVVLSTSGEVVEEQAGNMDEEEVELPDASLSVAQLTAAETSPVDASPSEEDDPPHSKRRTPISRASLSRPSSTGIIDRSPDKLAEAKPPTRPASQKSSRLSGSRASSVNSKRRLEKQKGRSAKDLADGDHDVSANDTMVPGNEEVTENGAAVGLDQDGEEEGEVESTSGKVVEATDERDSSRRSSVKISGLPELPKAVSEL